MDDQRYLNFDLLRLAAAGSVIFSHAFVIADGHENNEPFVRLTGAIIGTHGVFVFLIISGFLVTGSLLLSSSLWHFVWKRFLRIYPALAVCAAICAFAIAPFFSEASPAAYFQSLIGPKYVAKVLLLYNVHVIPSVSFYTGPPGHIVNGSLWTIACEIYCYLLLAALAAIGVLGLSLALLVVIATGLLAAVLLAATITSNELVINLAFTLPSFLAGVATYFIYKFYGRSRRLAIFCAIGWLAFVPTGYLILVSPILAAYPIIYLGTSPATPFGDATRYGDLSYGTYLYGWPIEQVIRGLAGSSFTGWSLCALALPLAAASGWLSWHGIEKRALIYKNFPRIRFGASRPEGSA